MSTTKGNEHSILGFLTVRQHPELGYLGGFLLVNSLARPLEFHCTLPVKPTRAQSILYGPTLVDFLCGEQIARTLVSKAKLQPVIVFTDSTAVLSLRNVSEIPVCCVSSKNSEAASKDLMLPPSQQAGVSVGELSGHKILVDGAHRSDWDFVVKRSQELLQQVDLLEPFTRIVEALQEAHPASKAA
ncbi:MAG: hypothetical protein JNK90_26010 [Planctomycetaceae bacterium]|nr:hypothetical protein [Planctomycetaceae bacterium]MBN8602872.1 hypothetical protein [Planctomycetota bacterium]